LLDSGRSPGLAEARLEISHHITCYNAERRHSALGNRLITLEPIPATSHFCPA
jgi:hypothetical protein